MTQLSKMAPVAPVVMVAALLLSVAGCSNKQGEEAARAEIAETPAPAPAPRNPEAGHGMVLLRGLPTLGTANSIAIVELDPESPNFGAILQEVELPHLTEPLHHLYYSPAGRLYATGLDPKCSLAEVALTRDAQGKPVINEVKCLDTGGQQVGEDIFWHPVNGKEQMFVTFMGGTGLDQADCGSVGVFDPQTNALVKTIEARKSTVPEGAPFIMYPHGISAYGDRIVVGAASHPDLKIGIGNTITIIDANTLEPIQTIVVEDSKPVGFPSAPVEVLFVRPSIVPGVQPAVLVNTMMGFETWKVPYDEATKTFGAPAGEETRRTFGVPIRWAQLCPLSSQLENILERASAFCSNGTITADDLPPEVTRPPGPANVPGRNCRRPPWKTWKNSPSNRPSSAAGATRPRPRASSASPRRPSTTSSPASACAEPVQCDATGQPTRLIGVNQDIAKPTPPHPAQGQLHQTHPAGPD